MVPRTLMKGAEYGPRVPPGRHGGMEHPAGQDAGQGKEEADLGDAGRRSEGEGLGRRPPLPSREREERQGGRPQARLADQGLGTTSPKKGATVANDDDRQQIVDEFNDSVNMTRKELEDWLQTDESKSVGQSDGGGESKGHESGRKIVELLEKNKSDYTDDDVEHMKRVNGYVKRHLGQGPKNGVEDSNWRYSLMNWGHDPLK